MLHLKVIFWGNLDLELIILQIKWNLAQEFVNCEFSVYSLKLYHSLLWPNLVPQSGIQQIDCNLV